MDRKLFGTLAYRMISKAAADIPADQVCNSFLNTKVVNYDEIWKSQLDTENRQD